MQQFTERRAGDQLDDDVDVIVHDDIGEQPASDTVPGTDNRDDGIPLN